MKRCLTILLIPLATLMLWAESGAGQQVDSGIAWSNTRQLPPGVLQGVVVEASTGRLLDDAVLRIGGNSGGAISDSMGRFRLEQLPSGRYELTVGKIGYAPVTELIEVRPGTGVAIRAVLTADTIPTCGIIVCAGTCGDVLVYVREVVTGAAPQVPVVLRVQRDSVLDWAFGDPVRGSPSPIALSAGRGGGTYRVEVAAPGYATWHRSGVKVERGSCGAKPVTLQAWLLPNR